LTVARVSIDMNILGTRLIKKMLQLLKLKFIYLAKD